MPTSFMISRPADTELKHRIRSSRLFHPPDRDALEWVEQMGPRVCQPVVDMAILHVVINSIMRLAGGKGHSAFNLVCFRFLLIGCAAMCVISTECAAQPEARASLGEAVTFHASFDGQADADFALGDSILYHAPHWEDRMQRTAGLPQEVTHVPGGGRYGDGLEFSVARNPVIVLFNADRNVAYRDSSWSGTVSFWLSLNPDEDLAPGFSDPLLITSKNWNDAALFVDFTRDDTPRHFRFAAFADEDVWNQPPREWEDVPISERPMIEIGDPAFARDTWTHVVMTFERFNTGGEDGMLTGYLNGERVGTLAGREQTFSWNTDEAVIALGINYVGRFDDLALFDRALTDSEVEALYRLDGGVAALGRGGMQQER
jgi:hypothetical protein